jgi:phosphate acetyltransferase
MKRIFTIILMALSLLWVPMAQAQTYWDGTQSKSWTGTGTADDPILISTAEQLADITISCAETKQSLIGGDSTVAMLSFSTKGSAAHPNVDKVTQALAMVKERRPDLMVDGELQLDAAVVQSVADKKAPGSEVAGKANVLVFPDLQSGNIGYKLVQRFANASAIGPILQGMAKPVNDLSRGCSVQDVVDMIAITALQCE